MCDAQYLSKHKQLESRKSSAYEMLFWFYQSLQEFAKKESSKIGNCRICLGGRDNALLITP